MHTPDEGPLPEILPAFVLGEDGSPPPVPWCLFCEKPTESFAQVGHWIKHFRPDLWAFTERKDLSQSERMLGMLGTILAEREEITEMLTLAFDKLKELQAPDAPP